MGAFSAGAGGEVLLLRRSEVKLVVRFAMVPPPILGKTSEYSISFRSIGLAVRLRMTKDGDAMTRSPDYPNSGKRKAVAMNGNGNGNDNDNDNDSDNDNDNNN